MAVKVRVRRNAVAEPVVKECIAAVVVLLAQERNTEVGVESRALVKPPAMGYNSVQARDESEHNIAVMLVHIQNEEVEKAQENDMADIADIAALDHILYTDIEAVAIDFEEELELGIDRDIPIEVAGTFLDEPDLQPSSQRYSGHRLLHLQPSFEL